MTIINPKSISGITSITTASGADNLLTVHTNNTTERIRINNDGDVIVGSGITVSPDGDIFATGVTTATTFSGSGASLTNLPAANLTGTLPAISGANLTGVASTENIRTNTNATFLQNINVSGSTTTGSLVSSGAISGTTGTFTGDLTIPDKIVHTGDTDTAIRLGVDTVTVETGGSERTRVDSSGRFGIGTNNPDSLLHVYGATTGYAKIETGDGSTNPIIMHKNPDRIWHAGLRGDASDGYVIRDATESSNRLTIDTSGNVTVGSGNVVIGTSGKGIDFSASGNAGGMTSELLDDYEEGTWTPVFQWYTSGAFTNVTMDTAGTIQTPHYTKVGRWVTATMNWTGFQINSSTRSYARLTGLPFTSTAYGAALVSYNYCFSNVQNQGGWLANGQTSVDFYHSGNSWNDWASNSGSYLQLSCHYQAS